MLRLLSSLAVAALFAACSTTPPAAPPAPALPPGSGVHACTHWFARLDTAVANAGAADVQETRIAGHPHLRTNRFTAALASDRRLDDGQFAREVLPVMRALDREARAAELSNLDEAALAGLGSSRAAVAQRTEECADHALAGPPPIRTTIAVPDNYSTALRVLGGYAVARYPFGEGVKRQLAEVQTAFAKPLLPPPGSKLVRYAALAASSSKPPGDAGLLDRHQPVFEKEITAEHDLPGMLVWDAKLGKPVVQHEHPVIYRQVAFTRYHGQTLKQLIYTIWFGARPPSRPGDLLAGHLDGLIWRVTLDPGGEVLIYDSIHPCGCYHYFFPTPRAAPVAAPADEPEWAFVPLALRTPQADERVVLRVATRTHYLERVTLEARDDALRNASRLDVLPQDALRALPILGGSAMGRTRSAYGPDGLVSGTERAERFLFWPMGIASAGQMRQWGRHATAFVGRRHFDDADLFERRFVFKLAP